MNSDYVKAQAQSEAVHAQRPSIIESVFSAIDNLTEKQLPPEPMMNIIGSHSRDHFTRTMKEFVPEFIARGHITPRSNILDIGCGCGRFAIPLTKIQQGGRYYGFDVWPEGIKWCNDTIAKEHPNSQFHVVEANNNYYFEDFDPNRKNNFSLPFIPDNEFDFTFAISVFTHLVASDCEAYFAELKRTMKRTGIAYLTCFIVDRFFWDFVERTGMHRAVKEVAPGCYQAYKGQDFFTGFSMGKWREMIEKNGLRVICYETGKWAEKPGARLFQDTFIVVREDRITG